MNSLVFVLIFSSDQRWEKNDFFNQYYLFSFSTEKYCKPEILVKKFVTAYLKNSWKHIVNSIIDLLTYVFSTSNGPDQERYFALLQKFLRAACLVRARDGLNVIDEALEKIKKIDDLQVIFHIPIYLIWNYE